MQSPLIAQSECQLIAIITPKGGIGKTTTAVNLGFGLNRLGKKVLLLDLTPHADLTNILGVNSKYNIYAALARKQKLKPVEILNGLSIIPSNSDLIRTEIELGSEYILRDMLEPLRASYDFIIIDCSISLGIGTVNAIAACDEIIIPVQREYSLNTLMHQLYKAKEFFKNNLKISGLLTNLFDFKGDSIKSITEKHEINLFNTSIRIDQALARAFESGTDIFSYDSNSNGAQDYFCLCHEIVCRH